MRKQLNKEEMRREWVLEKWYEKTIYIIGYALLAFYALAFLIGIISGISENL